MMQASFVRQARFVHGGATADCCRPSCRAAARHQHSLCAVSSTPEAATERFVVSEADCGADYDKVGALRAAAFYEVNNAHLSHNGTITCFVEISACLLSSPGRTATQRRAVTVFSEAST